MNASEIDAKDIVGAAAKMLVDDGYGFKAYAAELAAAFELEEGARDLDHEPSLDVLLGIRLTDVIELSLQALTST